MSLRSSPFGSSVAMKYFMALTGLGWIAFVVAHLIGNLLLLSPNQEAFNRYSHTLVGLGFPLIAAEIVLLVGLLVHVFAAIMVTYDNWQARSKGYAVYQSRGKPSKKTVSSSTMIWTGLILLIFIPLHVYKFKYGPGIDQGYVVTLDGEQIRDLRRLVIETFSSTWWVVWYVTAMVILGFHLRHGFWSAFQSLGLYHPRLTPVAYGLGVVVGLTLAVGFIFIPIWVYLTGAPL
ncbi:MAG: succinate dehydrogenase cytochrome b subunit [Acidobacteria bacterium]|nr:MAG: succinate dehydrogenase cytochrome b subunit [Acidobacteriota bacterium]